MVFLLTQDHLYIVILNRQKMKLLYIVQIFQHEISTWFNVLC